MIRERFKSIIFKSAHRRSPKDFTRDRKLPFAVVSLLVIQKSLKSLQLVLNEFFSKFDKFTSTVTSAAFSQARQKLSHTAFIELTQDVIVKTYYADDQFRKFDGFRLIAVDGSKVRLPYSEELCEVFGSKNITHGRTGKVIGKHPVALVSVFYDVLNNLPIDAKIAPFRSYEVDLAVEQLSATQDKDLLIFDRNYPSYRFLSTLTQMDRQMLGRCSAGSFKVARDMFTEGGLDSRIVTLKPCDNKKKEIQSRGLPMEITVRFVRIILDTGEVEILVTSLLDEEKYPTSIFKELYFLRWGVETYYGRIKDHLTLENFTGKNAEAINQDFYATIFISALETVITEDAQDELDEKVIQNNNKYPQKVNKAVSFNAIKNNVISLFHKTNNPDIILSRLTELFTTNPVLIRKGRKVDRNKITDRRRYNHRKRTKKICF